MIKENNSATSDRELYITKVLNAPRALVYKVWTEPEHIAMWWGPNGFTTTIHEMDLKPGGAWNLTMHGPDGTDYKNKSVFVEVVKPERIVFDHISSPKFRASVLFEEEGNKTRIHWRMLFETAESLENVVKVYHADEGQKQNVIRLEEYLTKQLS
jgi:uncharacterized protein YndB with AHSA1/START domain